MSDTQTIILSLGVDYPFAKWVGDGWEFDDGEVVTTPEGLAKRGFRTQVSKS